MRKKDFEQIAQAIKDARDALKLGAPSRTIPDLEESYYQECARIDRALDGLSRDVSKPLAMTNPKFSRERFLALCGVR